MEIEQIIEFAKDEILQKGDQAPHIIFQKDDKLAVIVAPEFEPEQREELIDHVRTIIDGSGVTKYWTAFSAWMVDSDKSNKMVDDYIKKKLSKKDKSRITEEMKTQLRKLVASSIRPSQHPLRIEVLIVSQFDKKKGMFALAYKYKKNAKGKYVIAKSPIRLEGNMYSAWNIWTPEQFDLNEM